MSASRMLRTQGRVEPCGINEDMNSVDQVYTMHAGGSGGGRERVVKAWLYRAATEFTHMGRLTPSCLFALDHCLEHWCVVGIRRRIYHQGRLGM